MQNAKTVSMSRREARLYYASLSRNELPAISSFEELDAIATLARAGYEAALRVCPCACPFEVRVELTPEFFLQFEAQTVERNGNVRLKSSGANVDDLARMTEAGIDKLDNVKGAMLVGMKGDFRVISDGLHSLRAHMKRDGATGAYTNYKVRICFMSEREQKYFAMFGDGHCSARAEDLKSTFKSSTGKVLKGREKKCQYLIAKNLHSYSVGKIGGDHKSRADEIMATHREYRTEIEFICGFPWLASMEKGYHTKSYVLAVFADALKRADEVTRARLEKFIRQYAKKNSTTENEYSDGLFDFLGNPPLTVYSEKLGIDIPIKGQRQIISIIAKGVSFWLSLYLSEGKVPLSRSSTKRFGRTDTSTYYLDKAIDGVLLSMVK